MRLETEGGTCEEYHKLGLFNIFFFDSMWLIILIYTYLNFLLFALNKLVWFFRLFLFDLNNCY